MPAAPLPLADLLVLLAYFVGITLLGSWFLRSSRTSGEFMLAGGRVPGWALGLSIFATYLSSNTFLGIPGKAFATNWNALVFSFSLPLAAWIAARFFVPFYRRCSDVSAYAHLERRFGPWARFYALACYLLTQLARVGSILFGMALALQALLGWRLQTIILVTGLVSTVYTMLGGMRGVIWTDVAQSIILTAGALAVLVMLAFGIDGGPSQAIRVAADHGKFSLGGFGPDVRTSTFWVVLLYGVFVNLTNFGIDQNYVQRYIVAPNDRQAVRSLWLGALLYLPISLVFFLIGAGLFSYYESHPGLRAALERRIRVERDAMTPGGHGEQIDSHGPEAHAPHSVADGHDSRAASQTPDRAPPQATTLSDADLADRVLPHFIATRMPPGLVGLVIAGILAAAMSTISSSLNSSATVYLSDIHRRLINPAVDERGAMRVLHGFTLLWGLAGTAAALAMIGIQSILDTWWMLSGIFAGGMLGVFLLGMLVPRAGSRAAAIAVTAGVAVIAWMTLSPGSPLPAGLQSPFHASLIVVVGTLVILVVGAAASRGAADARRGRGPAAGSGLDARGLGN